MMSALIDAEVGGVLTEVGRRNDPARVFFLIVGGAAERLRASLFVLDGEDAILRQDGGGVRARPCPGNAPLPALRPIRFPQ
jgi:hypothetical protein